MRTQSIVMPAIASIFMLGSARTAELTGAEIKDLISGNTAYFELTASITGIQGRGVIYFDPNGTALYKTPKGIMWHGTWKIEGNTTCTDWREWPANPCSKYDQQGDTITSINVATGVARGKITKIVPGNAEKLTP